MKDSTTIIIIMIALINIIWGVVTAAHHKQTRSLINQNHTELLQLINTEKQAEVEFLESLRKAKSNRIKKGDELR